MHYNVKRHFGCRFIGSCRASLASNAAPWNYTKSEAIKTSLDVSKVKTRKCSLKWIDASEIGVSWELIPNFHDAVGEKNTYEHMQRRSILSFSQLRKVYTMSH